MQFNTKRYQKSLLWIIKTIWHNLFLGYTALFLENVNKFQAVDNYLVEVLVTEPSGITFVEANVPENENKRGSETGTNIPVRRSNTQAYIS